MVPIRRVMVSFIAKLIEFKQPGRYIHPSAMYRKRLIIRKQHYTRYLFRGRFVLLACSQTCDGLTISHLFCNSVTYVTLNTSCKTQFTPNGISCTFVGYAERALGSSDWDISSTDSLNEAHSWQDRIESLSGDTVWSGEYDDFIYANKHCFP